MTPTPPSSGSGGPSSSADPGPPPARERFVRAGWFDGLGELATGVEGPAPRLEKSGRPLLQSSGDGQRQPVRRRNQSRATRPWPSWKARRVGRPGGGGWRDPSTRKPAQAARAVVTARG